VLELNYTIPISSQLSIQPVLQWILQPGGSNRAAVVAAGMQLSLSF
jgi:carbohydrate-selective porin OprB